ncbi:MAG: LamG domain-containing protein [Polyangiales bacterium]
MILLVLTAACGEVKSPLVDAPVAPGTDADDAPGTTADAPNIDAAPDAALPACATTLLTRDATTEMLYRFNEGTSVIVGDASGHARDGRFSTVSSGATWTTGKFGGALAFVGGTGFAGDRVDIPLSPAVTWGSAFSVEMIVKPSATDLDGIIVGLNPVFALWSIGGKPYWRLNNSGVNLFGSTLDATRWWYVAATYDGATMRVYVDGQLIGTLALGSVQQTATDTAYLGCAPNDGCFGGLLDEVRVSSAALSAASIASTATRVAACQ